MDQKKEILEAINAGNDALYHLSQAEELLNKAKKWGLVDLFGGGMLISMGKNAKMRQANDEIIEAKYCIERLKNELRDVESYMQVDFTVDDFLFVADVLFDNFISDIYVQEKINQAIKQVKNAAMEIECILDALDELYEG